jgi:hypothetical protein
MIFMQSLLRLSRRAAASAESVQDAYVLEQERFYQLVIKPASAVTGTTATGIARSRASPWSP